jgi:predicted DNA-binding transcriptional regulator AlpA
MSMDLLTLEEAALLMRQPVNTLRYWRHIGKGPRSARLGARIMYRESDVAAWVDQAFERGAA